MECTHNLFKEEGAANEISCNLEVYLVLLIYILRASLHCINTSAGTCRLSVMSYKMKDLYCLAV